jgi:hypothetical protein
MKRLSIKDLVDDDYDDRVGRDASEKKLRAVVVELRRPRGSDNHPVAESGHRFTIIDIKPHNVDMLLVVRRRIVALNERSNTLQSISTD